MPSSPRCGCNLGLPDQTFFTDRGFGSLGFLEQQAVGQALAPGFLQEHNPIVRHTVLRRRQTLEEAGLLERVGVDIHPDPDASPSTAYAGVGFSGLGLLTNHPFDLAYQAPRLHGALQKRTKAAGFMKTLLLQRICSSFASGRATAEKMLRREVLEDEEQAKDVEDALSALTPTEAGHLRTIVEELSRPEARDPKLAAVRYFLTEHRTEGKTWLEHGCIVFSQYYDTAYWIGAELAKVAPERAGRRLRRRRQERHVSWRRLRLRRARGDQERRQEARNSPRRRHRRGLRRV